MNQNKQADVRLAASSISAEDLKAELERLGLNPDTTLEQFKAIAAAMADQQHQAGMEKLAQVYNTPRGTHFIIASGARDALRALGDRRFVAVGANGISTQMEVLHAEARRVDIKAWNARVVLEKRAKKIYNSWPESRRHPWVKGGNSLKQDEARDRARRELKREGVL